MCPTCNDDIFLNLIGGMLGYFIFRLLEKITDKMSKRAISTLLVFIILALTIVLLYMMM